MTTLVTHNQPEAITSLMRVLEKYIAINDDLRVELVRNGEITVAEAKADAAEGQRYADLLAQIKRRYDAPAR